MYYILNGKLVEGKKAVIPVTDHGFLYGDAIYETMRTRNGDVWLFNEHFKRFKDSAKIVGIKIPYKKSEIYEQIIGLIKKNRLKEARIRITLSRGSSGFDFGPAKNPTFLVEARKLTYPPKELYEKGIPAVTFEIERPMAKIKTTSMLPSILAHRYALKKKAHEAFLIDHRGRVTEGSMSNVFFVKRGKVFTPKKYILEGTVRRLVIKETRAKQTTIKYRDLSKMDEVFITSTTKGILPVTKINGKKVGDGKVGPVTKKLLSNL